MALSFLKTVQGMAQKGATGSDDQAALLFKALAHPVRIELARLLGDNPPMRFVDVAAAIPLSSAAVHQHLGQMVEAGVARRVGQGKTVRYSLAPQALSPAQAVLADLGKSDKGAA